MFQNKIQIKFSGSVAAHIPALSSSAVRVGAPKLSSGTAGGEGVSDDGKITFTEFGDFSISKGSVELL